MNFYDRLEWDRMFSNKERRKLETFYPIVVYEPPKKTNLIVEEVKTVAKATGISLGVLGLSVLAWFGAATIAAILRDGTDAEFTRWISKH